MCVEDDLVKTLVDYSKASYNSQTRVNDRAGDAIGCFKSEVERDAAKFTEIGE